MSKRYTMNQLKEALAKAQGLVGPASELLGCHYTTLYDRISKNSSIKAYIDKLREKTVDRAELRLIKAIDNGEGWAIALTVKTLGRKRGYVERVEQEHSGTMQNNVNVQFVYPERGREKLDLCRKPKE